MLQRWLVEIEPVAFVQCRLVEVDVETVFFLHCRFVEVHVEAAVFFLFYFYKNGFT
jgi:hypothetical protein